MKKPLIFCLGLVASFVTSAHAAVVVSAAREGTTLSTSGTFNFSSPDQSYSTGVYATYPVPSNTNTDLAEGKTPTLLAGSLHGVSGPVTNLTNGLVQTTNDNPGQSTFAGGPVTFQIDLGSDQNIAAFNSYAWHTSFRAFQTYTLLMAPSSVADPTNLSLYTTIGSVSTSGAPISFPTGGQQGVSFQSTTGSLGTYRYIVVQDTTSNGTFYGEFDVIAVPEPSAVALAVVGGMSVLFFRRRQAQ